MQLYIYTCPWYARDRRGVWVGALWRVEPRPLCRRHTEGGEEDEAWGLCRNGRGEAPHPAVGRRWHNHLAEIRGAPVARGHLVINGSLWTVGWVAQVTTPWITWQRAN